MCASPDACALLTCFGRKKPLPGRPPGRAVPLRLGPQLLHGIPTHFAQDRMPCCAMSHLDAL